MTSDGERLRATLTSADMNPPVPDDLRTIHADIMWREEVIWNRWCGQPSNAQQREAFLADQRYLDEESPFVEEHFNAVTAELKYLMAYADCSDRRSAVAGGQKRKESEESNEPCLEQDMKRIKHS